MPSSRFVYVTYIRTTQAALWHALTDPATIRQCWFDMTQECTWQPGSAWRMLFPDGRVADSGTLLEIEPERRFVIAWQNEFMPDAAAEGLSRMTCTLEPMNGSIKLTIIHEIDVPESKLISAVSGGWPQIIASLKSFLETGAALPPPRAPS